MRFLLGDTIECAINDALSDGLLAVSELLVLEDVEDLGRAVQLSGGLSQDILHLHHGRSLGRDDGDVEADRRVAARGVMPDYINKLLIAFEDVTKDEKQMTEASSSLIEPLSKRELEVLKLLTTELNGPEIARQLMVSLATMRTHTKNIYGKLGVNNRRAAVRRAVELDLLL